MRLDAGKHRFELVRRTDEIEVETVDRKLGDEVEVVAEAAEIGGEHQPRSRGGEPGVGALEGIALILGQVEDEAGLVDLHPVGTALRKPSEDLDRKSTRLNSSH